MNNRTSFALLAVLTVVGTLTMSSAYALEKAYPGIDGDVREAANQMLLAEVPISVWTDQTSYDHSSMIKVGGQVANVSTGIPVTLTVTNPLNSVVTIDQIDTNADGSYETMISTEGSLWKYDGTYIIRVSYGGAEKNNKVLVELTGGVDYKPRTDTPVDVSCKAMEVSADGNCIPFSISGGEVVGASINVDDKSIIVMINAGDDGVLTLSPSKSVIDGIYWVQVDDQEWWDFKLDGNEVTVMFPAGTEKIEIIGTFIIPEFGTIAAMILAVAIISIIAVSARSRLSIMPRY